MKNRSVVLVLLMLILVNLCQVNQISADSPTSTAIEPDTAYQVITRTRTSNWYHATNDDTVCVLMKYNTGTYLYYVYFFSYSQFSYVEWDTTNGSTIPTYNSTSTHYTNNNYDFYYKRGTYRRYTSGENVTYTVNNGFYEVESEYSSGENSNTLVQEAFGYAESMLNGEEEPDINFGSLKVGYNTDFVSSGSGVSGWNKDNISWSVYDSNNNLLDDMNYTIELRAIPGYYKDVSQTQLLLQSVGNFFSGYAMQITNGSLNLEPFEYYTLYRGSPGKKSVSFTWAEVVDKFDMTVDVVNVMSAGDYYYKAGWRYEIRYIYGDLEDPDYTSPWQIIYQVTSAAPQTSEDIYNAVDNGLSPELYNLLQTVNTLNNTVQNWNINGVPIQMEPNQTMQSDGSWIEALINAIASIVGTIGDFFGNILNFFSELLVPSNFEIPDFQEEQQNLIEHTGIFGQSIQMTQSIQQTIQSVQEADPVFSFPGFSLNQVELVPSFEVDLNDVVVDLGLEQVHNTELLIMDGIVYLSLFLVVKRKLVEVLKK